MTNKPLHIQARLHPGNEHEARAIEVYQERIHKGQLARQIIADALLSLDGQPIHIPEGGFTLQDLQAVLEGMRDMFAETISAMFDERMEELAAMSPADRKRSIREAARSSFRDSILNSVDVAEYEGDE
jgi:hypothetical protein